MNYKFYGIAFAGFLSFNFHLVLDTHIVVKPTCFLQNLQTCLRL